MENNLRNLLEQLRLHHEAGNRHEFIAALRTLMDNRLDYFRQGMEETALLEGFADGLYKLYAGGAFYGLARVENGLARAEKKLC